MLDGSELRAILPPALVLVGDHSALSSGAAAGDDWAVDNQDFSSLRASSDGRHAVAEKHYRDADISLEDHDSENYAYESDVSELDSVEIDHPHDDDAEDDGEFTFQQPASARPEIGGGSSDNPPQRVIKISVPGKLGAGGDKPAAMMDIDPAQSRRRSKKGSPLKTMIGVILGGLLAFPIVGTILHFATGQYIPYISDILPGGGVGSTQTRANQPMPTDYSQPPVAEQPSQTPLEGQSIGDDLRDVPTFGQLPDPADAALQAITGGATNANTGPEGNDPNPVAVEAALPEAAMPDTHFPSSDADDRDFAEGTADDDAPTESVGSDSSMLDDTIAGDDLFSDDLPASTGFDSVDPAAMSPNRTSDGSEADFMEEDAIDFDDAKPLDAKPLDAKPLDAKPLDANPSNTAPATPGTANPGTANPAAPETDMNSDADDLFADTSENPFPDPVAPAVPVVERPSLDVDTEVAKLTSSLDQITGLAADNPQRGQRTQRLYESLTELAGNLPAGSAAKLIPLLDQISSNTSTVIAFAKATPAWVNRTPADRGGDGIVVVGKMSGDSADATFTLLNRQELPVTLPETMTDIPSGFQIGLGRITGSGPNASLTLELLQSVKQ